LNTNALLSNNILRNNYDIITNIYDQNSIIDSSFDYNLYSDYNTYFANLNDNLYSNKSNLDLEFSSLIKKDLKDDSLILNELGPNLSDSNYLMIIPDWDSAVSRITQISAIGDVLYTVYHSYIYIVSVILLLGMVGAIILTADHSKHIKIISFEKPKSSNILASLFFINIISLKFVHYIKIIINYINRYFLNYYYNIYNFCFYYSYLYYSILKIKQ
jgi:hypothetical protein